MISPHHPQHPGGDEENASQWMADLLARYERPLLKHAYSFCSDRELARDAVQETFFRLIRNRPTHGLPDNPAAWLFTVCRNIITDHQRRQNVVRFGWEVEDGDMETPELSPDDRLERRERDLRLVEMVAELPERERELVRLKFQVGLSYKEIERVTGISQGNIGYFLHKAVKELKARWHEEGGGA